MILSACFQINVPRQSSFHYRKEGTKALLASLEAKYEREFSLDEAI